MAKISENMRETWQWVANQFHAGADAAQKSAGDADAKDKVKEEL